MKDAFYFSTVAVSVWCALQAIPAQGQVRYMDRVPTRQEIRESLGLQPRVGPAAPGTDSSRRAKGIEWALPAEPADRSAGPALALPVAFERGTAHLSKSSLAYLRAVAEVMADHPDLKIAVEGHTDGTGDPRANFVLSWERSLAVFRAMVDRYGIDPERLQPVGKGATEPLSGADPTRGINRRVQFRTVGREL